MVFHNSMIRLQQEILNVVRSDDLEAAAGIGVEKGGGSAVSGTGIPFEFEGGQASVAFLQAVYLRLLFGAPEPGVAPSAGSASSPASPAA